MPRLITLKKPKFFRGLLSHYRMVFVNEKSLEEVASFRLTKGSVYGMLSTIFLGVALVTLALLVWTPLRFYIPGYGNSANRQAVLQLRQQVDSLTDVMAAQDRQLSVVKNLIAGEDPVPQDTVVLTDAEIARAGLMPTILPQTDEIQGLAEGKPLPIKPGFPVPKLKRLPPVLTDSATAAAKPGTPAQPGAPAPTDAAKKPVANPATPALKTPVPTSAPNPTPAPTKP